jgi:hypothetical protein
MRTRTRDEAGPTRRSAIAVCLVSAMLFASTAARADDLAGDGAAATLATTNPLPITEQLKLTPTYTFSHGATDYRAEFQFEPVLPYRGLLIPDLDIEGVWSIARIQLTAESLQDTQGTASGLENLNFVDVAARRFGALTLGLGFATVFPMATSSALGPAKWQLGPAAGFHDELTRAFTIGALVQALWSVAGSSEVARHSYVTVQPFLALHLDRGVVVKSDETMSFYWAGGSTTIPVNLGVGYAFSKRFVGTIKGALTIAGSDQGTFKAALELAFLP